MTATAGEIRWGTGYDNAISFDYPQGLDDTRTWRRPAPGSRRARNPAGTTDAWINRRDFVLAGRARYFARQAFGSAGLSDFLDWAGEGNAFRFIPDNRYPSFYVDSCVLDSPFDGWEPQLETSDGSQTVDLVIRQQAFDFTLAARGLMFEYVPGKSLTDPSTMVATFTRAQAATRWGRDGIVASDASGVLRDRHFDAAVRYTLLEQARTKRILWSEDFTQASWSRTNITVTPDNTVAPDGTTTADKVAATASAATTMNQSWAAAESGSATLTCFVKKGSGATDANRFGIRNSTTATDLVFITVNYDTLAITYTTGSTGAAIRRVGTTDWYELTITATAGVTIGDTILNYYAFTGSPETAGEFVYLWGAGGEAPRSPTSYVKTTNATITRPADILYFPFAYAPQEMTVYVKGLERGTGFVSINEGLLEIGDGTNASLTILNGGSNRYQAAHTRATQVTSTVGVGTALYDTVELRLVFGADGAVTLGISINGGAESVAAASAANPFPPNATWALQRIYLGSRGAGATPGNFAFQAVRVMPGTRTLAELRAA